MCKKSESDRKDFNQREAEEYLGTDMRRVRYTLKYPSIGSERFNFPSKCIFFVFCCEDIFQKLTHCFETSSNVGMYAH